MTLADKLTLISQNEYKVYEAGQKAEYDRFWDEFQQNGNRSNYTTCFNNAAWTDETLNPKYDITVKYGEGTGLFRNCTNITSTKKPIRFRNNTGKATYVLNGCLNLETIPLLEVDEAVIYTGWFGGCKKLKNITIEGVIGADISFKDSPLLSNESVDSIIAALKGLTGATALSLTVHADVYARMVANGQDVLVTAKNWALVS